MAFLVRDLKSERGRKMLEKLEGEQGECIRHYVSNQDAYIKDLQERIKDMRSIFEGIKRYL